jgi:peptide/nickel transport system substrate-binding protein
MMDAAALGRRGFLAGAVTAVAGCTGFRSAMYGETSAPVSLSIKTTPTDNDPYAIRIARHLAKHLEAVGIRTEISPIATEELLRSVLVDYDFDLYVARHSGGADPDFLRPFVHSRFGTAEGWYNPFGFGDVDTDRLLERQRYRRSRRRRSTVSDVQWELARKQPFTVVAHPDTIQAVRTDRVVEWPRNGVQTPGDLLGVRGREGEQLGELRVATLDPRATRNRNPIAFEFRDRGLVMGLLYEPLARWDCDGLTGRLAAEWSWRDDDDTSVATVQLRPGEWHDGRPITADDVAFTVRFLSDTTLDDEGVPVPAPRFRGRTSLVAEATAVNDRTVELRIDASREVARRALTLPVLPRNEWEPRARRVEIADVPLQEGITEALTWQNPEPVGSGPLAFERAAMDEALVLTRVEDHFIETVPFERLTFRVAPSGEAAVELVVAGEVDATDPLDASLVPKVARANSASLVTGTTGSFYHVGYNTRNEPLTNPRFRLAVAALLDRERVQSETFSGFAIPTVSPLSGEWVAPGLEWDGIDPVAPFPGNEGSLDVSDAKEAFVEAGYRFREDGRMVE